MTKRAGAVSMLLACAICGSLPVAAQVVRKPIAGAAQAASIASLMVNQVCLEQFDTAPFCDTSYKAHFVNDRWVWGDTKAPDINGWRARVSFDSAGFEDSVWVQNVASGAKVVLPAPLKAADLRPDFY